jgi:hypothetical protein
MNGEPDGSPFFVCCVVSEATLTARVFSGDAHRKSGVFSFGSALSPVESCSLQSLMSSRFSFTPAKPEVQAKRWRKCKGGSNRGRESATLLDKQRFAKLVAPDK